ncbi:glycosyltransferase [Lacinutrix algicola]|uniref:glycosyltransferase n=1 Tax=Lacinutrix algicola TaxID=342954 RepID=UPI0006E1361F|nr:glycosyltransferase [Lacinutrix algicola]
MKLKENQNILINVLTRTSNRPFGFSNCHNSVVNQTYKHVKHIVSYDNEKDLDYLNLYNVEKVKVNKDISITKHKEGYIYAPYNLYCNALLNKVTEGWVVFLDDDDNLLHNKVLEDIVSQIRKGNEDTLFIWQMRYPNGRILPSKAHFKSKEIKINGIGSCCMVFHSKYKNEVQWDEWKGSDFRFIEALSKVVPNKKWIEKVYTQINNFGDFGKQNDISKSITNNRIYNKNILWYFLPKYHQTIFGIKVFRKETYSSFFKRVKNKIGL